MVQAHLVKNAVFVELGYPLASFAMPAIRVRQSATISLTRRHGEQMDVAGFRELFPPLQEEKPPNADQLAVIDAVFIFSIRSIGGF